MQFNKIIKRIKSKYQAVSVEFKDVQKLYEQCQQSQFIEDVECKTVEMNRQLSKKMDHLS